MTHPVRTSDVYRNFRSAPEQTRWAVAVAAYGQRLRNDPWVGPNFSWQDIVNIAMGARGEDDDGTRSQFIQLANAAQRASRGAE